MLKQVTQRKIKENWEFYKEEIEVAFLSTEGGRIFTDNSSEQGITEIYGRLMNPFNHTMHLWSEGKDDYILLTQVQVCEFTDQKTLVIFSLTRTKDVDNSTILQRWFDGYPVIKKFAKENECVGIIGYSDLEYITKIVKEVAKSTKQEIIIRYQYYVPLN